MPGLLARIGIYLIATGMILDGSLHYFGNFEYHFPLNGTFSIFLLPLGILLILAAAFGKLNSNSSAAGTRLFLPDAGPCKGKPLEAEPQPFGAETAQMTRRPLWTPLTSWVAVCMVLLSPAIYAAGHYWRSTRTITAVYESVYAFLQWLAVGLVAPGLAVFALSFIRSKRARFEVSNTADPGTSRPLRWPLRPRFTSLPSRGLISFSLAVPLIIVMWVVQFRIPQRGFWVSAMPVSRNVKPESLAGKLVLRIDIKKRLYLNSERIPAEELTQVLTYGLARHTDRVVYVDGDRDLEYRDVVAVMDEIRGLHAKVILLTPGASRH